MAVQNKQRLKLTRTQREKFDRIRRLEQIQSLDPVEFEYFVGHLYQRDGYSVFTTVTSGDEGVDLFLRKGAQSAIVQCKRYSGTVGQPVIRDLYGAMFHNEANEAILVTSGVISRPAEDWAQGKPITLIDGHELMSWSRRSQAEQAIRSWPLFKQIRDTLGGVPWTAVAVIAVVLLCGGLAVGSAVWALNTFNDRTGSELPPPPTRPQATAIPPSPTAGGNGRPTPTLAPTRPSLQNSERSSSNLPDFTVPRFDAPPAIDGNLSEWPNDGWINAPYITERLDSWDGNVDVNAIWYVGWDADNLYFAAQIEDDRIVQEQIPQFAYLGDSLEIQIDTNIEADYAPEVSPDDFQYVLSPGDFAGRDPGLFRFQGTQELMMSDAPGTNGRVAARRTTTGYNIEAAIPWSDINVNSNTGLTLGVALSVNDNDKPGEAIQELMLSHVATRLWLDPTSWGSMTLQ